MNSKCWQALALSEGSRRGSFFTCSQILVVVGNSCYTRLVATALPSLPLPFPVYLNPNFPLIRQQSLEYIIHPEHAVQSPQMSMTSFYLDYIRSYLQIRLPSYILGIRTLTQLLRRYNSTYTIYVLVRDNDYLPSANNHSASCNRRSGIVPLSPRHVTHPSQMDTPIL